MTVTYGFYDSLNGDRKYNAKQMSQIFKGIIADGIFQSIGQAFIVGAPGLMTVSVGSGRAWFNDTWTDNDASIMLTVLGSEPVLPRIDTVVIEVNSDLSVRANSIKVIKGTPSSNPVAPTMANTSTLHQYPLADIYVAPGDTAIGSGDITNRIGVPGGSPFATGAVPSFNFSSLLTNWQTQFSDWFNNLVDQLSGSQVANLQAQIDVLNAQVGRMDNYKIVASSSANNYLISLKTLAGTDPSAADPCMFKIGNDSRTLQSALTLTIGAGFNVCNLGRPEIATRPVQIFVYIGWRVSNSSIFLLASRIPYARTYSDFSQVITSDSYGTYTGATPANGDFVANIGRIEIANTGAPNYNWYVPGVHPTINKPIYETDWLTFLPIAGAGTGAPVFGTNYGQYLVHNGGFDFDMRLIVTNNNSANNGITGTVPFFISDAYYIPNGRESQTTGQQLHAVPGGTGVSWLTYGNGHPCPSNGVGYTIQGGGRSLPIA